MPHFTSGLTSAGALVRTMTIPSIPVLQLPLLRHQQFHALIGRDILNRCVLIYNGSFRQFTLAF